MTIAVTGAKGYIGSRLLEKLKDQHVIALDIDDWDIKETGAVYNHVTTVVHLAGLVKVGESVKNPIEYYKTNIVGTMNVLDCFPNAKIIFASTGAAFNPTSPYAKSKVIAEEVIKLRSHEYTIFRFYNVGGGSPTNEEGLYKATQRAVKSGVFVVNGSDYATSDGTPVRDYVHVDDICDAIIKSINEPGANTDYECLGSGNSYTVKQYIEAFCKVNDISLEIQYAERRAGDNAVSEVPCLSNFIKPKKTLEDIVRLPKPNQPT